jgi:hypothetical protein
LTDCDFTYYEHTKRILGVVDSGLHYDATIATKLKGPKSGSFNTVRNCVFAYCDGGAFEMEGRYDRFDNVLAHDLDWSGVGFHTF